MTGLPDRLEVVELVEEARVAGARRASACEVVGLDIRTLQRWEREGLAVGDRRPVARRAAPANKLSEAERRRILELVNQPEHASLPPGQIVPRLADAGQYIASESSFYRVMKAAGQQQHRGRARAPQRRALTTHAATGRGQVWCWDITYLPSAVKGQWYYWYMMEDVYSRYLVANEVHAEECSAHAAELLTRASLREGIGGKSLVLHSDNGSAMKGATMLARMQMLGVVPSFSRPRVSDDNAYAEALFRTGKYCPLWPSRPFGSLEEARMWVERFVQWYNHEHRHSGIRYVTPAQRHRGEDIALLEKRKAVYAAARARHPLRWSGKTRNWQHEPLVWLNREKAAAASQLAIAA